MPFKRPFIEHESGGRSAESGARLQPLSGVTQVPTAGEIMYASGFTAGDAGFVILGLFLVTVFGMGVEELIGCNRIFEGLLFLILYGASLGAAALGIFLAIFGIKNDFGALVLVGFFILLFDWLLWDDSQRPVCYPYRDRHSTAREAPRACGSVCWTCQRLPA
jgi:hypothetical protein